MYTSKICENGQFRVRVGIGVTTIDPLNKPYVLNMSQRYYFTKVLSC